MSNTISALTYTLIIIAIYFLGNPKKAYFGNYIAFFSILIAIFYSLTMLPLKHIIPVISIILLGAITSIILSSHIKIPNLPQIVAIFNGFGGISSAFIGLTEIELNNHHQILIISIISLGFITFSSSFATYIKLQNIKSPIPTKHLNLINLILLISLIITTFYTFLDFPKHIYIFSILSSLLGFFFVLTIGGADMPIIISILNSCSGLTTILVGFSLNNILLIIIGTIITSSGFILTHAMTKAMNRKFSNIFFNHSHSTVLQTKNNHINQATPKDAAFLLENAHKIIIIPGYGLASSNAQHELSNMTNILKNKYHIDVKFAIHPVAGRMPGHMNVLLAEANISPQDIFELNDINQEFKTTDIALIIGANDITNPLAKTLKNSSIYQMPILEAQHAKRIIVIKRSLSPGYAGIDNPLFYLDKTLMLLGDAQTTLKQIISILEASTS